MVFESTMNVSVQGLAAIGDWSGVMTVVIMAVIALALVTLIKFFGRIIMGAAVTGALTILYFISRGITNATVAGNYVPVKWLGGIVGGIVVSFFVGWLVELWFGEPASQIFGDGKIVEVKKCRKT